MTAYVDASALVKLVVEEPESGALAEFLGSRNRVTSEVAVAEVARAVTRQGSDPAHRAAERALLATCMLIPLDELIIERAGVAPPTHLGTLDALHLATALRVQFEIGAFVSYDHRLNAAAESHGLPVVSPA